MREANGNILLGWPLTDHILTAGNFYNDGSSHGAIDLRAAVGTPVYAAEAGVTDWVQIWDGSTRTGLQSYGTAIRIKHADYEGRTLQTRYAHLSGVMVYLNERVEEGQLIGYTGATGNVSGPHLHFEVIWGGARQNPLTWLDGDFSKASASVYTYAGGEGPAAVPAGQTRRITLGPLSAGDAETARRFAEWLGLVEAGLYRAEDAGEGRVRVVLGPLSAGDADFARQLADYLDLVDAGLYQSEIVR